MPPNLSHHECVKGTSQIGCHVFLASGRTRTSVDSQDSEIDTWGNSRPLSVLAIGKTSSLTFLEIQDAYQSGCKEEAGNLMKF